MQLVDLDGRRVATWDRGEGTPLLFIHGVGTPGALWQTDLAELAADCRVIVYDRRGYGVSSDSPRALILVGSRFADRALQQRLVCEIEGFRASGGRVCWSARASSPSPPCDPRPAPAPGHGRFTGRSSCTTGTRRL
jgi:Alpha/beta hydrolase family